MNRTDGNAPPSTLSWRGDAQNGVLRLIDQTRLPAELRFIDCDSLEKVDEAIQSLRVRGAPAIGVAAAYGVVIGLQQTGDAKPAEFLRQLAAVTDRLAKSRPTAVNLFWALERMEQRAKQLAGLPGGERLQQLLDEARRIEEEDRQMCAAIGRHGAELLRDGMTVLTHCNAGGLATAGDGTALSVIFAAAAEGKRLHVFADETRPLLQGARLTAWELQQRDIPVTVLCDSAAGWMMRQQKVDAVLTGADRIAANGDAANKIGTYTLAVLARVHGIPFYIAAPSSTFDLSLKSGEDIPIEERRPEEVARPFGQPIVPEGVAVANPAFDVTPAEYIETLITERGLIHPVTAPQIAEVLAT